jgi:Family of unknown function (DUF6159)
LVRTSQSEENLSCISGTAHGMMTVMAAGGGVNGWYQDPYGRHQARYFSAGQPTKLVRDGAVESYDEPPAGAGPGSTLLPTASPAPHPPPPPPAPGVIEPRSGGELFGVTSRVLAKEPLLMAWLVLGAVGSIGLLIGCSVLLLGRWPGWTDLRFPHYLILIPALVVAGIPSTFTNSVVFLAADQRLAGRSPRYGQILRQVRKRWLTLLAWSVLAGIVGVLLQFLLERLKIGGRIVTWLIGLSWVVATSFVIPCIVFEELGVGASIRRSAQVFKQKWGLNVRARVLTGGIGIAISVAIVVISVFIMALSLTAGLAVLVALILAVGLFFSALQLILTAALYRYTVDGVLVGDFTEGLFHAAFRKRRD